MFDDMAFPCQGGNKMSKGTRKISVAVVTVSLAATTAFGVIKANNIYDLAGNCWEWTQEAYGTNTRARRGGDDGSIGSDNPVYSRLNAHANDSRFSYIRFSSDFNNRIAREYKIKFEY